MKGLCMRLDTSRYVQCSCRQVCHDCSACNLANIVIGMLCTRRCGRWLLRQQLKAPLRMLPTLVMLLWELCHH